MESGTPGLKATEDAGSTATPGHADGDATTVPRRLAHAQAPPLAAGRAPRGHESIREFDLAPSAGPPCATASRACTRRPVHTCARTGQETFEAVQFLRSPTLALRAGGGRHIPAGRYGDSLKQVRPAHQADVASRSVHRDRRLGHARGGGARAGTARQRLRELARRCPPSSATWRAHAGRCAGDHDRVRPAPSHENGTEAPTTGMPACPRDGRHVRAARCTPLPGLEERSLYEARDLPSPPTPRPPGRDASPPGRPRPGQVFPGTPSARRSSGRVMRG